MVKLRKKRKKHRHTYDGNLTFYNSVPEFHQNSSRICKKLDKLFVEGLKLVKIGVSGVRFGLEGGGGSGEEASNMTHVNRNEIQRTT